MTPPEYLRQLRSTKDEGFVHAIQSICEVLIKKSRFDDLLSLLSNLKFLEVQVEEHRLSELLFDLSEAIACLPKDKMGKEVLLAIDDALRRNRSFINANPKLLFQCLWNACWWSDCAELKEHLAEATDTEGAGGGQVARLMEHWREQKEADADFIWFRSLRPPRTHTGNVAIAPFQWSQKWKGDGVVLATSPDGNFAAHNVSLSEKQVIVIRDASTLQVVNELAPTLCVATVKEQGAPNGERNLMAHACIVAAMAFSRDSKNLIALVHDSTGHNSRSWFVCSWKVDTLSEDTRLLKKRVSAYDNQAYATISSDGAIGLFADTRNGLYLFDAKTGAEIVSSNVSTQTTCKPEFSNRAGEESVYLACPDSDCVRILPVETGGIPRDLPFYAPDEELPLAARTLRGIKVAVSPNGKLIAHVLGDGSLNILDVSTGKSIRCERRNEVDIGAICFSPDGKYVVSGEAPGFFAESNDAAVLVFDSDTGRRIHTLGGHTGAVDALSWPKSADYFLTISSAGTDETIRKWRIPSNSSTNRQIQDHPRPINQLRWCNDGTTLEAQSKDGSTLTWDIANRGVNCDFAISPQRSRTGEIRLWQNPNPGRDPDPLRDKYFSGTTFDIGTLQNRIAPDSQEYSTSHAGEIGVTFNHDDNELTAIVQGKSEPIAKLPLEPLYTGTVGAKLRDLHPNGLVWAGAFGTHIVAVSLEGPGLEQMLDCDISKPWNSR